MNNIGLIEGLLFVAGDEGLTTKKLSELTELKETEVKKTLEEMKNKYENAERGIRIEVFGETIKLVTKKEYKEYIKKFIPDEEELLTQSNLETLAIIAYNQPITRTQVEEIRGVGSTHIIRKLLITNLIKEKGRSDLPGRPILYGTTDFFLDYFGITSLDQLPIIETEKEEDEEEKNLFESKYKEI